MEKHMTRIFSDCQLSAASHSKLIKKLTSVYLKSDFEKFCGHFIHLMKYSLIHEDTHPVIERTLAFVAKFSTSVKSLDEKKETGNNTEEEGECDIDPFLVAIFKFLLQNHEANSRAVRLRVCHLINRILNSMGEQASIDDHLYNTIYDTMLQRLMDKVPAVRVQAIHALARLQDPRNKECPVIKAYLFHLSMDPNPEVRKAVLSNIAITFQTLPDILDRIRDTRELVRRQTYLTLAQKVHLRSFTIAQRILIVSEGLNDRSTIVRQAVRRNLLQAWLRLVNGSILELLKCLDVEASTESAELVLKNLFLDIPYSDLFLNFGLLDGNKLIPLENLKPEAALYWKCLAKYLRSEKADEYLDELLPDLSRFCDYLREWVLKSTTIDETENDPQETAVKMMEKEFVCQQLIDLAPLFDLSDEVGRRNLCSLVRYLLISPSLGEPCIKGLNEMFAHLYPPEARVDQLMEIISDLREPPTDNPVPKHSDISQTPQAKSSISDEDRRKNKLRVAQLSVKIHQARDELEDCIRTLDLDLAKDLKTELEILEEERNKALQEAGTVTPQSTPAGPTDQVKIPEEEEEELKQLDDPDTLSRCLLLVCEFLSRSDIVKLGPMLRSLHDNLIIPCLKSEDLRVRRYAVKSLALICLLSKELAQQHLLLFIQISQMDVEEIQLEALRGLFDSWLLYGVEEFNSAAEDITELPGLSLTPPSGASAHEPAISNMIALLTKMLETESGDARTLTVEGLCKLLFSSRICSSKLLSHLVILWYNPITEDDHLLRHILGVFFPFYASLGGSHQEALADALIPTLHTLFDAPTRSPLADVDVEDVVNFMVSITSPALVSKKSSEMLNVHDSFVFTICAEILAFPSRDYIRALIKSMPQLTLSRNNFANHRQVLCLTQKITKKLEEKRCLNYLTKFQQTVQAILQLAPEAEEEDEGHSVESVTETDQEDAETTVQNSSQQKRKRMLFTSQIDLQLVSDVESSENDEIPSKTKRLSTNRSDSDVFDSLDSEDETTKLNDTEENDGEEAGGDVERKADDIKDEPKSITQITEIELSVRDQFSSPGEMNETTSDLFASAEESLTPLKNKADSDTSTDKKCHQVGGPLIVIGGNQTTPDPSSSSNSESPPRKSPKLKIVQSAKNVKKKKQPLSLSDDESTQDSWCSPSSSHSLRSTRSSLTKLTSSSELKSTSGSNKEDQTRVTRGSSTKSEKLKTPTEEKQKSTKKTIQKSIRSRNSLRSVSPPSSTTSSGKPSDIGRKPPPPRSKKLLSPTRSTRSRRSNQSPLSSVISSQSSASSEEEESDKPRASSRGLKKTLLKSVTDTKRSSKGLVSSPSRASPRLRSSSRISGSVTPSSEEPPRGRKALRSARKN